LSSRFSGTASIDIGLPMAVASGSSASRISIDFREIFMVEARRAFQSRGNRFPLHVGEGNPQTTKRAPCGDIAAHGACTDDMDMPKVTALPRALLHLFAQKEHADQVLRRAGHGEARKRRRLNLHYHRATATMALP
jgi:hypothetical protein